MTILERMRIAFGAQPWWPTVEADVRTYPWHDESATLGVLTLLYAVAYMFAQFKRLGGLPDEVAAGVMAAVIVEIDLACKEAKR